MWPSSVVIRSRRLPRCGFGDLALSQILGFPSPLLMLPTLLGALVWLRLDAPMESQGVWAG
jgi:hypothetical protein